MSEKFRTVPATVLGLADAKVVANKLFDASQWFTVEPLPDDEYQFTVKEENAELLNSLVPAPEGYFVVLVARQDLDREVVVHLPAEMTTHHQVSAHNPRHALRLACQERWRPKNDLAKHANPNADVPHLLDDECGFHTIIFHLSTATVRYEGGRGEE